MEFFRRATIALANGPDDVELLRYAARVAAVADERFELCFVHVLPDPNPLSTRAETELTHAGAVEAIRSAVAQHVQTSADQSFHVLTGPRLDKLLQFVAESGSDLILVGHGRGRTGRRSLGRRLAMKAPCSLWMAPAGSPATVSRIVAGVDFSPPSAHALSFATLLARRLGLAECTAVYVRAPNALSPDDAVHRIVLEQGERAFDRFVQPLELHDVRVRFRIEESGSVASSLLRAAAEEGAELIVMGTRGLSNSAAVLLGSETEQTVRETDRPVLITKHRGERLGLLEVLLDRDLHPKEEPRFG